MSTAYIALGGNIGNVRQCFIKARAGLDALPGSRVSTSSLLYRTPPLGPPGQPDYLNAVVALVTCLPPLTLLDALQQIETRHGRERGRRWAARTLDLDIVAIDALCLEEERLQLPHPLMQKRQFVLRPLCDIASSWQHPHLGKTAVTLLQELLAEGEPPLPKGEKW